MASSGSAPATGTRLLEIFIREKGCTLRHERSAWYGIPLIGCCLCTNLKIAVRAKDCTTWMRRRGGCGTTLDISRGAVSVIARCPRDFLIGATSCRRPGCDLCGNHSELGYAIEQTQMAWGPKFDFHTGSSGTPRGRVRVVMSCASSASRTTSMR